MAILGRKPGTSDLGYGYLGAGNSRGSIVGSPAANGWGYRMGVRAGRQSGSGTCTMQLGLYETENGSSLGDRMAITDPFNVSAVMEDRVSGADHTANFAQAVKVYKKFAYATALGISDGNGTLGQDNSGHPMHFKNQVLPNPYGANSVSPQGKTSTWLEYQANRKPKKPTGLVPANGAHVTSSTPTLAADFRDDDETLPGISLGNADSVFKYRFQILNSAKTQVVRDSGLEPSSLAQRTARRVTYTPSALPADKYVARVTVWDQFDVPSETAEWSFTVNAGGVFEDPDIAASDIVADRITNSVGGGLQIGGTWEHASGLNLKEAELTIQSTSGASVRGPSTWPTSRTPGQRFDISFSQLGWDDLVRGQLYRVSMRGKDSADLWSDAVAGPYFRVNSAPAVPTSPSPVNVAIAYRPQLSVAISDVNDASSILTAEFAVRPIGSSGDGVVIPASQGHYSSARHRAQPTIAEMPSYGVYEWRSRGIDPWGLEGEWTAWQTITYALPPNIVINTPGSGETITTGTPVISGTSDKALVAISVEVRDSLNGVVMAASGQVTASGTSWSWSVPPGMLRNGRPYIVNVEGVSTELLSGSASRTFNLQYPQPSALASITVEPQPGPFEPLADPKQWSRTLVTFLPATVAQVSDEDFAGYALYRTDLSTGVQQRIDANTLASRDSTAFLDRTPTSGVAYLYEAAYLTTVNIVDVVESVPVSGEGMVVLQNTVICTLDTDDLGVPLRYWEERRAKPVREWQLVPSFGSSPIPFQGRSDYRRINGVFGAVDDRHGTYGYREIIETIERMGAPVVSSDGVVRARSVNYRDPRGRNLVVVINNVDPADSHWVNGELIEVEMTEVSTQLAMETS